MKPTISGHYQNDDDRHWRFVRNTNLPHGTFDKDLGGDKVVLIVSVVCALLAVALVSVWP